MDPDRELAELRAELARLRADVDRVARRIAVLVELERFERAIFESVERVTPAEAAAN